MVFMVVTLLSQSDPRPRKCGFIFIILIFLLDGLDGFLARKLNASNNVGSLIDTLGDRITENVLLFFFAYRRLIPLFIPLVFICRSLITDFIRFLAFNRGMGTFDINKSRLGFFLVASKFSRSFYLILKFAVFLGGASIMVYPDKNCGPAMLLLYYAAIILVVVNLLRFAGVVFDARKILKSTFLQEES